MMEVPLYDDFDPVPLVVRRASIIKEPGPPQPANDRNTENKVSKQSKSQISKKPLANECFERVTVNRNRSQKLILWAENQIKLELSIQEAGP